MKHGEGLNEDCERLAFRKIYVKRVVLYPFVPT